MIDILLAAYNGEKYISQQLYSLQMQTYSDWICYIHDDGSTDSTVQIIKDFVKKDARFLLIEDDKKFGNPAKNFLHLIQYSHSEFCCFCDQDDIWLDNKIKRYVDEISKKDNSKPQVVFFNAYLWNSVTNEIKGNATLAFPKDMESLLYLNCGIQGCSSVFNNKMVKLLSQPLKEYAMHDHYLTLLGCSSFGEISYIHENLMLYRQHSKNITGEAVGNIKTKYKTVLKGKAPVIVRSHLIAVKSFYEHYKDMLSFYERQMIEAFIESENFSIFKKIYIINKYGYNIYGSKIKLIMKIFLRPYIG